MNVAVVVVIDVGVVIEVLTAVDLFVDLYNVLVVVESLPLEATKKNGENDVEQERGDGQNQEKRQKKNEESEYERRER